MAEAFTFIDLFAGAGGMTQGFVAAGLSPVFAVEIDSYAAKTYASNFGCHVYPGPIEELAVPEDFPRADLVVGGPPCQGFSPLGRNRDDESRTQLNNLWRHFLRGVRASQPKVFVLENVPQFLKSAQFDEFLETCRRDRFLSKFEIERNVLNAAEYGIPQIRRRGFVIASRIGTPRWPTPTHGPHSKEFRPYRTVREALSGIPLGPTGRGLHFGRNPRPSSIERYKAVPEGGNRFDLQRTRPDLLPNCWRNKPSGTTDVFGRLWWDRPAFTIRTEFFKPEKGRYLHPEAHRPITHREAARLQTFPDDFHFEGSNIEIAKQIGNAVPPDLARAIAEEVLGLLRAE